MLRTVLWIIGIILFIIGMGAAWGAYYFSPKAERILDFVAKHPEKSAIMVIHNGELIAAQNEDTVMPLASAVKTIIAIEFAYQVANQAIDTATMLDTIDLDKYYIPETDGGAHQKWLNTLRENNQIVDGKVSLMQVAKGMIHYSSNANSEYLMWLLGLNQINARLDSLRLDGHQPIYPFVSAMLVCMVPQGKDYNSHLNQLYAMDMEQYRQACMAIHETLPQSDSLKKTFYTNGLDLKIQKVWSTRLPGGSCKMYAQLMQKLNEKALGAEIHAILDPIMERLMESKNNAMWLDRAGKKGGSTAYVLTETLYATDKENNQTALAVFFNNLTTLQNLKLQMSMNEFDLRVIQDKEFRKQLEQTLKQKN
jgi:D-alanyl-D-alanine carboxypeptidase